MSSPAPAVQLLAAGAMLRRGEGAAARRIVLHALAAPNLPPSLLLAGAHLSAEEHLRNAL